MNIRPISPQDQPRLARILQVQGFDYELPDLQTLVAGIALEESGQVVQAALAQPTVEVYFLGDPGWRTPQWRFEGLKKVHETMRAQLEALGFPSVHVWLPPQVEKPFGRRLMRSFGWTRPQWTDYTRLTAPRT